jgi:hypothetical protein
MKTFITSVLSSMLIFAAGSCKIDQQKPDGYSVKLRRDDNSKELVLYDTIVSLDYLTEGSKKYSSISNFEFFEGFNYPVLESKLETNNRLVLFNDSVNIVVETKPFDTLLFKRNLASDRNYYTNKSVYGGLPSLREISNISIRINGRLNEMSSHEFENMFDPNIISTPYHIPTKAYLTEGGEILLQMDNGAGAEFYYLIFLFDKDGNVKKRIAKNVL